MIGGSDVFFDNRLGTSALVVGVRAILVFWKQAVFENGDDGTKYERFADIPFGTFSELFVYRDQDISNRWEEEGAVPGLEDTMIHLVQSPGTMTVVVDDPDSPEMKAILFEIQLGLRDVFRVTSRERSRAA